MKDGKDRPTIVPLLIVIVGADAAYCTAKTENSETTEMKCMISIAALLRGMTGIKNLKQSY